MTGHLLNAADAIEGIIWVLAVHTSIISATINVENLDSEILTGLNIILGKSIEQPVDYALSKTFGFGVHTATSIF